MVRDLIEEISGLSFSLNVKELICDVLGLDSIELATTRQHLARLHCEGACKYHPGWVYHDASPELLQMPRGYYMAFRRQAAQGADTRADAGPSSSRRRY